MKLTDFGICHQISILSCTKMDARGTILFLAPELVNNDMATTKVDMWSVHSHYSGLIRKELRLPIHTQNVLCTCTINSSLEVVSSPILKSSIQPEEPTSEKGNA